MKKMFLMMTMLLASVVLTAGDLAKMLPADADVRGELDMSLVFSRSDYKPEEISKMAESDEKFAAVLKVFADRNIALENVIQGVAVGVLTNSGNEPQVVAYVKTGIAEKDLPSVMSEVATAMGESIIVSETTVNNHKLFCVDDTAMTYVASDVLAITGQDTLELFDMPASGNGEFSSFSAGKIFSLVADMAKVAENTGKINQVPFNKAMVSAASSGALNDGLCVEAIFDCINKEAAQQLQLQIQMSAPFFVGMAMNQEPELARAIISAIAVNLVGEDKVEAKLDLSAELLAQLQAYSEKMAAQSGAQEFEVYEVED